MQQFFCYRFLQKMEMVEEKLTMSTLTTVISGHHSEMGARTPIIFSPDGQFPPTIRKLSSTDRTPSGASSRRDSMTTQSDSRRSSFTPESPYMTSDETRARDTLLEPDPEIVSETISASHNPAHRGSVVTQMLGRATELISEVAEIVAGVVPLADVNPHDERRAEFFITTPSHSMDQGQKDFPGKANNDLERRNSLTPESPYQVSDETRSRKENLEDDISEGDEVAQKHVTRSGSHGYERLE